MQFPVTIGLRRSRMMPAAVAGIFFCGLPAIVLFPGGRLDQVVLGLFLLLTALLAWRQLARPLPASLRLQGDGQLLAAVTPDASGELLQLLPGMLIHPWLTVFRAKRPDGRVQAFCIAVDMLPAEDFRQLRVFLRWLPRARPEGAFSAPDGA